MKIQYFKKTDTLYIEFRKAEIAETRDLDQDTVIDVDADGNIVAMTMEHARKRSDAPNLSFEEIAA
jgi:uncharacterized protein YuzE